MVVWVVSRHDYDETIVIGAFTSLSLAALAVMREIHAEQMSDIMDGARGNTVTNWRNYGYAAVIVTNDSHYTEWGRVEYEINRVTINE